MDTTGQVQPITYVFTDDGSVPNNPLPFVCYRGVIPLDRVDPESTVEVLFATNNWGDMWRNGVFNYLHYHSMTHEAMGVARGRALVRFGGDHGKALEIATGDAAILPAGIGHQCLWASNDFSVVGAYPNAGKYDLVRPSKEAHARALQTIPNVPLLKTDPVFGPGGPVVRLWGDIPKLRSAVPGKS
jgi:uncharacterized protein YjlB